MKTKVAMLLCLLCWIWAFGSLAADKIIRVGLIGLDTSHAPAFTKLLNDTTGADPVPGARVVCAFPGGSDDLEASYSRVERFTAQIRDQYHVEIVPDIPSLLPKVDAVILTSVDGRVHLEQVKPVIQAKKPVFIDKPMAASLEDVRKIFELARRYKVPCFSASSLRYFDELQAAMKDTSLGNIVGCVAYGPSSLEPHHPDLFWYGIHAVEILFTVMGPGCRTVQRTYSEGTDIVTGLWADGRIGTFRGIRSGKSGFGALIFSDNKIALVEPGQGSAYRNLLQQVITFFETGLPPVSEEETLAIFEFMDAADQSKHADGAPIKILR